jgi:SNF2 family DNA or RNA helicase
MRSKAGFYFEIVLGFKNKYKLIEDIKKKGAVIIRTKQAIDLPNKNFEYIDINNTVEYKKLKEQKTVIGLDGKYYSLENEIDVIDDKTLQKNKLIKFNNVLKYRKFAGAFNKNKLETLKELLNEIIDRVVIFYNLDIEKYEIIKIIKELKKPYGEYNGAKKELNVFENNKNAVMLAQSQAGSKGLNLQKSNKIIYFSPFNNIDNYIQSIARINRLGQNRPCYYYKLKTLGTIEEKMYKKLDNAIKNSEIEKSFR